MPGKKSDLSKASFCASLYCCGKRLIGLVACLCPFLSYFPDAVFLILYKELYYRHIYAKVSVSVGPVPSCGLCVGFSVPANLTSLSATNPPLVP